MKKAFAIFVAVLMSATAYQAKAESGDFIFRYKAGLVKDGRQGGGTGGPTNPGGGGSGNPDDGGSSGGEPPDNSAKTYTANWEVTQNTVGQTSYITDDVKILYGTRMIGDSPPSSFHLGDSMSVCFDVEGVKDTWSGYDLPDSVPGEYQFARVQLNSADFVTELAFAGQSAGSVGQPLDAAGNGPWCFQMKTGARQYSGPNHAGYTIQIETYTPSLDGNCYDFSGSQFRGIVPDTWPQCLRYAGNSVKSVEATVTPWVPGPWYNESNNFGDDPGPWNGN